MRSPVFPDGRDVELKEILVDGIRLNICPESGGVWFDGSELDKFDEVHEPGNELSQLPYNPELKIDPKMPRRSPRHPEIIMTKRFFGPKQEVEIDVCPQCGGIWLDRGELEKIKELYPTEEDRNKLSEEMFDQMFAQQLADQKLRSQEKLDKARKFRNMFKFILPSHYISKL